ncbi:hypothetical protein [Wolbachia endosymbiont of Onchocerca volvulus]|nr:hypothetical protein [Wolbachia endosymbiont of Onchocerca volvulus]CAL29445.1 hypothetical protein OW4-H [Wolbachia endosymbiont of Onchocerca volvulus]
MILSFCYYTDLYGNIVHLKNDNKEFKIKPENFIESTISHREKYTISFYSGDSPVNKIDLQFPIKGVILVY